MVEAGGDRGFAPEAIAPGCAERAEGQDLHGGLLARHALLAPGAVDHGHAAAAELVVERPVAEEATGQVVADGIQRGARLAVRSEEHTSELQSLMRISYAVFCLKKKTTRSKHRHT